MEVAGASVRYQFSLNFNIYPSYICILANLVVLRGVGWAGGGGANIVSQFLEGLYKFQPERFTKFLFFKYRAIREIVWELL